MSQQPDDRVHYVPCCGCRRVVMCVHTTVWEITGWWCFECATRKRKDWLGKATLIDGAGI